MTVEELQKTNHFYIVSLQEALDYLGIDYADEIIARNISRASRTAHYYLTGALGSAQSYDARVKELALMIISDLYENRGLYETVSGNLRKLVDDMCLQIRLESKERRL